MIGEFISEDDLHTFEGWLKYQCVDPALITPSQLSMWRGYFDEARERSSALLQVGLMKLQRVPGDYQYAVAVRERGELWLVLWVKRSHKKEFFVMVPRSDREWNAHTSYHLDGRRHAKSYGRKVALPVAQPLNRPFQDTVNLGVYAGYGPKGVGAVCKPADFNGVVEVPPGILGPRDGAIIVDLVAPGCQPVPHPRPLIQQRIFRDAVPWVVVGIAP
jgi:hypothetical protein